MEIIFFFLLFLQNETLSEHSTPNNSQSFASLDTTTSSSDIDMSPSLPVAEILPVTASLPVPTTATVYSRPIQITAVTSETESAVASIMDSASPLERHPLQTLATAPQKNLQPRKSDAAKVKLMKIQEATKSVVVKMRSTKTHRKLNCIISCIFYSLEV